MKDTLKHDPRAVERTLARVKSCARSVADVRSERKCFVRAWQGDELAVLCELAHFRSGEASAFSQN